MKKILILTIALATLFSCSSEENEKNLDPIIGTWYTIFAEGEELDNCSKKTNYKFNEDGTAKLTGYGLENNDCKKNQEVAIKWSKKSENLYTIQSVRADGKDDPASDVKVKFSDNNTKVEFLTLGIKLEKK